MLKVLQWNVCDEADHKSAIESALAENPDIACIQELAIKDTLSVVGYTSFTAIDTVNENGPVYLAILIKKGLEVIENSHRERYKKHCIPGYQHRRLPLPPGTSCKNCYY